MSEYIVCVDGLEKSYYRYTDIKPETVFGHRLREEIVRCRDCEYSFAHGNGCGLLPEIHDVEPDGFCAWASRKEVRDE